MNITQELRELLQGEGCTLYGFADITVLPEDARKKLPVGIVMAYPLVAYGVQKNEAGQDILINAHGGETFEPLERYTEAVTLFLKERKYKANTKAYLKSVVTDKTVGTLGGLGWIGNCALLTTKEAGPAVRIAVILTNAPLECNEPIMKSLCPPDCMECKNVCPTQAISGKRWERGVHRDDFFDVEACKKGRTKQGGLCWQCISVCPLALNGIGNR